MTFTTLAMASDVLLRENNPTANYAGYAYLGVSGATDARRRSLLYFNLPFPRGVQIVSATLTLFQKGAATGGARVLTVNPITSSYQESKATWANQPTTGAPTISSASQSNSSTDGRPWTLDITSIMQAVSDGATWYGLRVSSTNTTIMSLYSREDPDFAPVIDIEFADAPLPPTELAPSAGRSVSLARPTLRFDFADLSGDTSLTGVRVRMNLNTESATPSFDSGVVDADVPEYVPTFDVAVGETWFWQAQTRDGAGLWSDWSEWESFKRTAKPTVTITAPTTNVFQASPTLAWTVTGGTQKAYQVFIVDAADPTSILWDSTKRTSTATSITVPKLTTPVLSPGGSYVMVLRVWDTVTRENTPGDPVYTEKQQAFTFGLSGTVPGATSLTAGTSAGPEITLTFVRASDPDSWTIVRDDVTIATNLDGDERTFIDRAAEPRKPHTYKVLAVVGGLSSQVNPTATGTTSPDGLWVVSADGLHAVNVANRPGAATPLSVEPNEVSEVHKPVGGKNPVLRTSAVYGRAGAISGSLTAYKGDTLEQARAHWAAIKANRATPVYVTAVDSAFRATLYNFAESLRDELAEFVDIDCDYFEVR